MHIPGSETVIEVCAQVAGFSSVAPVVRIAEMKGYRT